MQIQDFPALLIAALSLFVAPAHADDPAIDGKDRRFTERSEEGWFWYKDPPEEEIAPEEKPAPEPLAAAPSPSPAKVAPTGPAPLSAAWLQQNIKDYQIRATDDPSPENIRAYLLLQRLAMDKASQFSEAVQAQTLGDPLLDATSERPLAPFATQAADAAAWRARAGLIAALSANTGLVFFFTGNCAACEAQAPVLAALARNTGFSILPVSLDGQPPVGKVFESSWVPDQGQSRLFGLNEAPAIFLMRSDGNVQPVAQGVIEGNDLMNRILVIARREGWISEAEWQMTRGTKSRRALVGDLPDPAIADDAAALVNWLEANMQGSHP